MAFLDGLLDVLRIVIATADDDRVLDPALDAQLAVFDKGKIAATEEWTFAGAGQIRMERLGRLFRPLPIAIGDVRAADPDLAQGAGSAFQTRLRIDDEDPLVEFRLAAADDLTRAVLDIAHHR